MKSTILTITILIVIFVFSSCYAPRDNIWDPGAETEASDSTGPSVKLITPADGNSDIDRTSVVRFEFDDVMDRAATEEAFSLTGEGAVSGNFSWSEHDMVMEFTPDALELSRVYTAAVGTAASDTAGNPVISPMSSSFRIVRNKGVPDATFNEVGILQQVTSSNMMVWDVVIDSSDRILITGQSDADADGSDYDMFIMRFTEDGTADDSFGVSGLVTHHGAAGGNDDDCGRAVILDSSDRILVAGWSKNSMSDTDMVLWCYDENGDLDGSFGSGGLFVHAGAAGGTVEPNDGAYCISIDTANRIIVGGFSRGSSCTYLAVWRLSSNGLLDSGFNTSGTYPGVYTNEFGDGGTHAKTIAVDSAGRIIVGGSANRGGANDYYDFIVCRFNDNGTLDTSFSDADADGDGYYMHDFTDNTSQDDMDGRMCLDTEDRIIVTGRSENGSEGSFDLKILRLDTEGDLDTSFGTTGTKVYSSLGGAVGDDVGYEVVTDAEDKILVTGCGESSGGDYEMYLLRLNEDGSLHEPFSSSGNIITSDLIADDIGSAMVLDRYGRIVIAGSSITGNLNNFTGIDPILWRFE